MEAPLPGYILLEARRCVLALGGDGVCRAYPPPARLAPVPSRACIPFIREPPQLSFVYPVGKKPVRLEVKNALLPPASRPRRTEERSAAGDEIR